MFERKMHICVQFHHILLLIQYLELFFLVRCRSVRAAIEGAVREAALHPWCRLVDRFPSVSWIARERRDTNLAQSLLTTLRDFTGEAGQENSEELSTGKRLPAAENRQSRLLQSSV